MAPEGWGLPGHLITLALPGAYAAMCLEQLARELGVSVQALSMAGELVEVGGLCYLRVLKSVGGLKPGTTLVYWSGMVRQVEWPKLPPRVVVVERVARLLQGKVQAYLLPYGYPARLVDAGGRVLAVLWDGHVCPYTSMRVAAEFGEVVKLCRERMVDVLVTGVENPYTPYFYQDAPRFGVLLLDPSLCSRLPRMCPRLVAEADAHQLPSVLQRCEQFGVYAVLLVGSHGRRLLYVTRRGRLEEVRRLMWELRIGDLRLWMLLVEEAAALTSVKPSRLETRSLELGLALLEPLVEHARRISLGLHHGDTVELWFPGETELNEFRCYVRSRGLPLELVSSRRERNGVVTVWRRIPEGVHVLEEVYHRGLLLA